MSCFCSTFSLNIYLLWEQLWLSGRILDLRLASRGVESQKSQWWWQENRPTLICSNKVSLLIMEQTPRPHNTKEFIIMESKWKQNIHSTLCSSVSPLLTSLVNFCLHWTAIEFHRSLWCYNATHCYSSVHRNSQSGLCISSPYPVYQRVSEKGYRILYENSVRLRSSSWSQRLSLYDHTVFIWYNLLSKLFSFKPTGMVWVTKSIVQIKLRKAWKILWILLKWIIW